MSSIDGRCIIESVKTKGRNSKTILHDFTVDFPSSGVTAILGPSGSGKTTFMSVITDTLQTNLLATGSIQFSQKSVLVPQDDHLHGFFTCRSYLQHYAHLAGIANKRSTNERIDFLLKQLGLWEQAGTIVGDLFLKGLSGGQKRRLSIALEALTSPALLCLDEPTSGLDAESALQVMEFLRQYASTEGQRVILTIHQPSSFIWKTIDHVVLLSKGKLMYGGPLKAMESFFSSVGYPTPMGWNPADHYITVVNDEFRDHALSVNEWAEAFTNWRGGALAGLHYGGPSNKYTGKTGIRPVRQESIFVSLVLVYRYFLNLFFNPGILGTRIAMYSMLALMVGALFWDLGERNDFESVQSRAAVLFYCVAFFIFMSVAVLPFTVIERGIVDKEVQNHYYHPIMYQLAQAIASIPGTAILAFLVSVIIITTTKLQDPYWYFLNMFLSLFVAEALAQMVSHIVPHFVIGMALLAGLYGFFMLFQGFMLVPSDFPDWLAWTYYVGPQTYAWRTFMVSEFRGDEAFEGTFATGNDVLKFFEIEDVNRFTDMIVLVVYALIVHCISFGILTARHSFFRGRVQPLSRGYVKTLSLQVLSRKEAPPQATAMTFEAPTPKTTTFKLSTLHSTVEVEMDNYDDEAAA